MRPTKSAGARRLADLTDVDITNRADGRIPVWDEAQQKHVYETQEASLIRDAVGEEIIDTTEQTRVVDPSFDSNLFKLYLEEDMTLQVNNVSQLNALITVKAMAMTGDKVINFTNDANNEFSVESPTSILITHGTSKTFHIDIADGFATMITVMDAQTEFVPNVYYELDFAPLVVDDPVPGITTIYDEVAHPQSWICRSNGSEKWIEITGVGTDDQAAKINALDSFFTGLDREILIIVEKDGAGWGPHIGTQMVDPEEGYKVGFTNDTDFSIYDGSFSVAGNEKAEVASSDPADTRKALFYRRRGNEIWANEWLVANGPPADLRDAAPSTGIKFTDGAPNNTDGATGIAKFTASLARLYKFYAADGDNEVPLS